MLKETVIASIASSSWIIGHLFASYSGASPHGILGRYEKEIENVLFVSPFWIWHEGW
jgi:hypothetical protein